MKHVSETGDEVWTVRAGSPRLVSIDFIRDICDIADKYCDGHLRFTSRSNVEFMTPKKENVEPIITGGAENSVCRWAARASPSPISCTHRVGRTATARPPTPRA